MSHLPSAPALVIFVGLLLAAFGGVWQAKRQSMLNETIIRLQNENIAQLTGADSFCHVDVTFSARNSITFVLGHSGTYTVPEVTVQLQDSAELAKIFEEAKAGNTVLLGDAFALSTRATKIFSVGNVIAGTEARLLTVSYTGERRNFFISIMARNGFYRENITVMRLPDGRDVVDAHLFRSEGDKGVEIWQQVSDAFPRAETH